MAFTIVLATRNNDKAAEIRAILQPYNIEIKSMNDFPGCPEVEEDGATLEENALKKARAVRSFTGLPAVADDTGLEVYYLLRQPGVYSARYAGENATYQDNVRKLLREMTQVPRRRRGARFRTVAAYVDGTSERCFEGCVEGEILFHPRGTNGFGYDPVFQPEGSNRSFAEMTAEEKNAVSHRGRAVAAFAEYIAVLAQQNR